MDLALSDLQKILLGKRDEPLSSIEIRNLFSYPTTPESILYLITALNTKKLDPHTTLIQSIANATKKEDLIPVALSLRYGADPNLYVDAPNIGNIHILGYLYLINKSTLLQQAILLMLKMKGTNYTLPIFDKKGGVIKDEFSLVDPIQGQTVLDWLTDQGFSTYIDQLDNNFCIVDSEFLNMVATFMDQPSLVTVNNLPETIASHSMKIFRVSKFSDLDLGLKKSIDYLNLTTYEYFMDEGEFPKYYQLNDLILSLNYYAKIRDIISENQIKQMLLYAIDRGVQLDNYQFKLINDKNKQQIKKKYETAYWIKICKNVKGNASQKLKTLAYHLNLNPEYDKETLCYQIKKITQADPSEVKKSVIKRQKLRVNSSVAHINEYIEDDFNLLCSNRSVLKSNVYDYPDPDLAFYRDDQESLWCFNSNNYLKILEKGINPYTNKPFPNLFLKEVERKLEYISLYRDPETNPVPISETIDNLNQPDVFTSYDTKEIKNQLGLYNLTTFDIEKMEIIKLQNLLNRVFKINTNLVELGKDHAIETFYVTAEQMLNQKPELTELFYNQLINE